MKRKLCWELDDIVYLKFHHETHNMWNRKTVPHELAEMIRQWNQADSALYEFFNRTLWDEIKYEGEGFWKELKEFREILKTIENDCVYTGSPIADDKFILDEIPTGKRQENAINPMRDSYQTYPQANIPMSGHSTKEYTVDTAISQVKQHRFKNRSLKDLLMYSNVIRNVSIDVSEQTIDQNFKDMSVSNFQSNDTQHFDGDDNNLNLLDLKENIQAMNKNEHNSQDSLTINQQHLGGSGNSDMYIEKLSNAERMLSKTASSWNTYFCKKLLMTELEYLDYFRRKHAYAKTASRPIK